MHTHLSNWTHNVALQGMVQRKCQKLATHWNSSWRFIELRVEPKLAVAQSDGSASLSAALHGHWAVTRVSLHMTSHSQQWRVYITGGNTTRLPALQVLAPYCARLLRAKCYPLNQCKVETIIQLKLISGLLICIFNRQKIPVNILCIMSPYTE